MTQVNLNTTIVRSLSVPVPPYAEQLQIIDIVEEHLSIADAVAETLESDLIQASRLRQSILKRAFEGKLVPQDPIDEPAEKLLERIKRARQNKDARVKQGRLL